MRIKYFPDTDTALMEFSEKEVSETKEINEDIYIDLDKVGNHGHWVMCLFLLLIHAFSTFR